VWRPDKSPSPLTSKNIGGFEKQFKVFNVIRVRKAILFLVGDAKVSI
jgi:hypothetical protein